MCDMAGPPEYCKNKLTEEVIELKYCGDGNHGFNNGPGIYHVGYSGCGYSHYDGELTLDLYAGSWLEDENKWQNKKYIYGSDGLWGSEARNKRESTQWDKIGVRI